MDRNRLLTAGRELIKGDFSTALKSLTHDPYVIPLSPDSYRGAADGKQWFLEYGGGSYFYFSYAGHASSLTAYEKCPPINAIINRKAQAYINGITYVLNSKGKEAQGEEAKKLRNLLMKPNPIQGWEEFEAQGYIYEQLFGFNLLFIVKPAGFKENIDATSMWNIPPSMVDIEETNKLFYQTDLKGIIKQIVLNYKGTRTVMRQEDLYIMKDFTPRFDSLVIPQSRICALEMPINNIIGTYESRGVLINNRGPGGIYSQEPGSGQYVATPMSPDEKEQLQQDFIRYGLKKNQYQFIITTASIRYQQTGIATKDLMLFEEIEDDIMRICDSYNYPYQLMSSAKGTTFSNVNEGKKLLYQDAIIPESTSIYRQWNAIFKAENYNLRIDKDYTGVHVLQEDQLQAAQARKARNDALIIEWQNDLITRNRWLELNGEDPLTTDGDLYYSEWKKKFGDQNNNNETTGQGQEGAQEGQGQQAAT